MSIDELIARLGAATEGSRELDVGIADIVRNWEVATDPAWRRYLDRVEVRATIMAPYYTSSVDAALTLVPSEWTAYELRSRGGKTRFVADLSKENSEEGEDYVTGYGSSLALAICIVALKVRAGYDN